MWLVLLWQCGGVSEATTCVVSFAQCRTSEFAGEINGM
jgi:hypothetical protein